MAGHIADSADFTWNTPQWIIEGAKKCFGGTIDLDPCSGKGSIVDAETEYILPDSPSPFPENPVSGLDRNWHFLDNTRCYVNPPFGRTYANKTYTKIIGAKEHSILIKEAKNGNQAARDELEQYINKYSIKDWVKKAAYESESFGSEIILLTPAAVGVSYFQDIIFKRATGVCFIKGRVKFLINGKEGGPSPMDLALSYFGTHYQHFSDAFSRHGKCILL